MHKEMLHNSPGNYFQLWAPESRSDRGMVQLYSFLLDVSQPLQLQGSVKAEKAQRGRMTAPCRHYPKHLCRNNGPERLSSAPTGIAALGGVSSSKIRMPLWRGAVQHCLWLA